MLKDFFTIINASASEPVTVTELKQYLQLDGTANDTNLQYTIAAVRALIEQKANISLIEQQATAVMYLESGEEYYLPYRPVGDVVSVTFEGDTLTAGEDYEILYSDRKAIKSNFTGLHTIVYELEASTSRDIINAVRMQAGHIWTHRDDATAPEYDRVAMAIINANMLMY